jgi:putative transposase
MPKPIAQRNGKVVPEQLVNALTQVMQKYVPLALEHTRIRPSEAWHLLAYAAVNGVSPESACQALPQGPSGNRLREVLVPALAELPALQSQLNRVLRAQLHPTLWKKPRGLQVAIDLVLIPYHGEAHTDENEVSRGPARSGTTHFHAYATAAIVHDRRRYTVALRFVRKAESLDTVVRWLLDRIKRLKLRLRRVYLDAGFSSVPVLRTLQRRHLAYLLPLPVRGRSGGVRSLFTRTQSYWGYYTLDSHQYGTCLTKVVVVLRYHQGRQNKHGRRWLAYAVSGLPRGTPPRQIYQWYRRRFGIESLYRLMNRVRARTSSRNPMLRLLFVGLALIFVNLYVTLRQACTLHWAAPTNPLSANRRQAISLDRLVDLFRQAIENSLGGHSALLVHQPVTFS